MDDELLDLVNSYDEVTGTINRKDYKQLLANNSGYIRASELFIVNDQGEIWTPIRTADKTIAPNGYDYSAAGHVESGDDYMDTIIRETEEEINLQINRDDIEFVAKLKSTSTKYFRTVYLLRTNKTPAYNKHDFTSAEWLSPSALIENIMNGHNAKSSLISTAGILQTYLAGN